MQGKQGKNAYFPILELKFFLQAERKRSRAEPSWKSFSLARTHHYNLGIAVISFFKIFQNLINVGLLVRTFLERLCSRETSSCSDWHLEFFFPSFWSIKAKQSRRRSENLRGLDNMGKVFYETGSASNLTKIWGWGALPFTSHPLPPGSTGLAIITE